MQSHSVKESARSLSEESGFGLKLDLGKSMVFRRTTEKRALAEWIDIPYLKRKSDEYARLSNPFAL